MNRRDFLGAAASIAALAADDTSSRAGDVGYSRRPHYRIRSGAPVSAAGHGVVLTRVGLDVERLGASTACLAGLSLTDALDELIRLGFHTVEMIAYAGASHLVGEIPGFDYEAAGERERERVFEATRTFRHLSAHMPFEGIQLLSPDDDVRRSGLLRIHGALDGLAFLGGSLAVVHVGWPPQGRTFRDVWPLMIDTFRRLGDYAGERGIRIGLETMQPNSVRDYTELIFDLDHPAVGATIDTGHIRGATDVDVAPGRRDTEEGRARFNEVLHEVIDLLGAKAIHYHLSDVRSSDWRDHEEIGTGIVDFPRLFEVLRRMSYPDLLVFELEEPETVRALTASKAYVEPFMRAD